MTYAVEVGNIYYDPDTGTITDCDTSVTSVVIPDTINGIKITSIGDYAFSSCENLVNITIPNSVTSIGDHVFEKCSNLVELTIPDSVVNLGRCAFLECDNINKIILSDNLQRI